MNVLILQRYMFYTFIFVIVSEVIFSVEKMIWSSTSLKVSSGKLDLVGTFERSKLKILSS